MPDGMSAQEAAEALAAAVNADATPPAQPPAAPSEPAEAAAPQETAPPPVEADQEALTLQALLTSVPDEYRGTVETYLKKREGQMQGDYTRKTQELAEQRQQFESDLQFLEDLRSDPQYALQFHGELTAALVEAGLTPGEASAAATEQIQTAMEEQPAIPSSYEDDPDAALTARLDALERRFADADASKEKEEYERHVANLEAQFTASEAAIRAAHPEYTDSDIEDIYSIAFSLDGNLEQANERFQALGQRWIENYANRKFEASSTDEPAAGGAGATPVRFETVEDAHKAAEEHLRNYLANQ